MQAYETGALAELRKWVQRNKNLAGALATAAALLIAGLIASLALKGLAENRLDDIGRLSALLDLEQLLARAEDLWPAHPENIDPYRIWMSDAQTLLGELPLHRARLAELSALASSSTKQERKGRWWSNRLGRLIEELESLERELLADEATSPEHGWSIPKRLAHAEKLQEGYAVGGDE